MTRSKLISLTLVTFVLSISVVSIALEVGLALAGVNNSEIQYIPHKGTIYRPHSYYRNTREGFSEGYINSHGFRDSERTYQKPPNTFRILVLGDSYTEAIQVALAKSFPALLERNLNETSSGIRFEVLNLGQSGFGTADEYMRYLNYGVKYDPDLVLLAFLTGNDFQDNSKFLNGETVFYFVPDAHGNLRLDESRFDEYEKTLTLGKRMFQAFKRHSYLASFVSERLYLLAAQSRRTHIEEVVAAEGRQSGSRSPLSGSSNLNIYLPDVNDHWKEAFAVTKGLLLKFRDTVEANGSRFLLVTLSNAEQVHPEVRRVWEERYSVTFDWLRPDHIIEEFAAEHRINHLELVPAFLDYHLRTGIYLHGFGGSHTGHWNENGHQLAADKIFDYLKQEHVIPLNDATSH